jgi:hypothetical protein
LWVSFSSRRPIMYQWRERTSNWIWMHILLLYMLQNVFRCFKICCSTVATLGNKVGGDLVKIECSRFWFVPWMNLFILVFAKLLPIPSLRTCNKGVTNYNEWELSQVIMSLLQLMLQFIINKNCKVIQRFRLFFSAAAMLQVV